MTREQFLSLPESVRSGLIYDLAASKLAPLPVPVHAAVTATPAPAPSASTGSARAPESDSKLSARGQYRFMSEMLLADLQYWLERNRKGSESGLYAETNRKTAATLEPWVAWRTVFPSAQWQGKRDGTPVTAALPSRDPQLHQWSPRARSAPVTAANGAGADDEIPF